MHGAALSLGARYAGGECWCCYQRSGFHCWDAALVLARFLWMRLNNFMKVEEVISDTDRNRGENLDRNAAQAAFQAKQEHFRQRLNQYNERFRKRKIGAQVPKRPEPPKPPDLN